jgi:transaldolase
MKPNGLKSKIFLDGGDPAETKEILEILGFLDGQTTNPTLVSKNPLARKRFEAGEKFSETELYDFYKTLVGEISGLIPGGSVSIEVYSDPSTDAETMLAQGREMYAWIPNAHIKYPTIKAGLTAAERSAKENIRVNMTLCFSQEQAAAVYAATKGAKQGSVFVSPFAGRLDDIGIDGMSLIDNILRNYRDGDEHVEVLAASIRTMEHFMQALALGADIITTPYSILKQWGETGKPLPPADFQYNASGLKSLPYQAISLDKPWTDYDIGHELTDKGVANFAADWNRLIG